MNPEDPRKQNIPENQSDLLKKLLEQREDYLKFIENAEKQITPPIDFAETKDELLAGLKDELARIESQIEQHSRFANERSMISPSKLKAEVERTKAVKAMRLELQALNNNIPRLRKRRDDYLGKKGQGLLSDQEQEELGSIISQLSALFEKNKKIQGKLDEIAKEQEEDKD